jgi:hypothetical protein
MLFQVYYAKNLGNMQRYAPAFLFRQWYEEVAAVEAADLEDVFNQMNDGRVSAKYGVRSMSVGDVVCDASGQWHYCEPAGWKVKEVVDLEQELHNVG